ncbi:MAG: asparagine synthetase A [Cyclobacteriaceae bacterium]|jgi:asparagine synthetase A
MEIKYTKQFLNRLEDIFSETDYVLRYEKGTFNSGYCVLKETKIAVVNKYYPLDGKINSLIEILKSVELETKGLSEKNRKLFSEISQTQLQF